MSIDMFLILIPFIIIIILFIITVGTFKSPICGYKKESDLVERLLKSLAVIVLPILSAGLLYKYYDYNPMVVFVRVLTLEWVSLVPLGFIVESW